MISTACMRDDSNDKNGNISRGPRPSMGLTRRGRVPPRGSAFWRLGGIGCENSWRAARNGVVQAGCSRIGRRPSAPGARQPGSASENPVSKTVTRIGVPGLRMQVPRTRAHKRGQASPGLWPGAAGVTPQTTTPVREAMAAAAAEHRAAPRRSTLARSRPRARPWARRTCHKLRRRCQKHAGEKFGPGKTPG